MFNNPFRRPSSEDLFAQQASSSPSADIDNEDPFNTDTNNTHDVEPHYVQDYTTSDGTHVEGYWRDGDGDTSHDLTAEEGGGYEQSNPDGDPTNNLG